MLYSFLLGDYQASEFYVPMYIRFRRRGITQKKKIQHSIQPTKCRPICALRIPPTTPQLILFLDIHYEMVSVTAIHRVIGYKGVEIFKMI